MKQCIYCWGDKRACSMCGRWNGQPRVNKQLVQWVIDQLSKYDTSYRPPTPALAADQPRLVDAPLRADR